MLNFSTSVAGIITPPAVAAVIPSATFTVPSGWNGRWRLTFTADLNPVAALADIQFAVRVNAVALGGGAAKILNAFANPIRPAVAIEAVAVLADGDVIDITWVSAAAGHDMARREFVMMRISAS